MEDMTTILSKEEDDIKKGMTRSVAMISKCDNNNQKRKPLPKNANDNKSLKKQNIGNKGNGQEWL